MCSTRPRFSEVSPALPLKQFQYSFDWRSPSLDLARKIVERFLFSRLYLPGGRWYDMALALCPQVMSQDQHLRSSEMKATPVYLLGHFSSLRHVHHTTSRVFEGGCRTLTCQFGLPGPPFTACSKLIEYMAVWGWCVRGLTAPLEAIQRRACVTVSISLWSWSLRPDRLHCLHGWLSPFAWQWSPTLTDLWILGRAISETVRSCGLMIFESSLPAGQFRQCLSMFSGRSVSVVWCGTMVFDMVDFFLNIVNTTPRLSEMLKEKIIRDTFGISSTECWPTNYISLSIYSG